MLSVSLFDPSRTFGSSILPAAIGRGRIDRFSSCGLGPSPSGLALAAGLVQHPAASQHPHTVRPVRLARCSLGLQRREEALHRRIVPDVAGTVDSNRRRRDRDQPLELLTGVLGGFKRSSQHVLC